MCSNLERYILILDHWKNIYMYKITLNINKKYLLSSTHKTSVE